MATLKEERGTRYKMSLTNMCKLVWDTQRRGQISIDLNQAALFHSQSSRHVRPVLQRARQEVPQLAQSEQGPDAASGLCAALAMVGACAVSQGLMKNRFCQHGLFDDPTQVQPLHHYT